MPVNRMSLREDESEDCFSIEARDVVVVVVDVDDDDHADLTILLLVVDEANFGWCSCHIPEELRRFEECKSGEYP
jgi:hypothetical protein